MINYWYYHWGPYLFKTQAPQHVIDRLKIDGKKTKFKFNHELAGNLDHQYAYPTETRNWFTKEICEIMDTYLKGSVEYHGTGSPELDPELELMSLWVNYMKPGDFNPVHTHSYDYSFVIFLDVPSELKQEMNNFEGTAQKPGQITFKYGQIQDYQNQWATTNLNLDHKPGDMYIFPAQLEHMVAPFKSDVTRISVSGNYSIVNKDKVSSTGWFA